MNWVYEIDADSSKPSRGGGDEKKTAKYFLKVQSIQLLNNVEALPDTKEKISVPLLSSFSGAQNTCSLFTERCQPYSPSRDNENHPYLECSEASLFHYSILQMNKMGPPKCFRSSGSRVSWSLTSHSRAE